MIIREVEHDERSLNKIRNLEEPRATILDKCVFDEIIYYIEMIKKHHFIWGLTSQKSLRAPLKTLLLILQN